jgi:hypothetical protein
MVDVKQEILQKLCYTELVYERIRKKLGIELSNNEIEQYIYSALEATSVEKIDIIGKNFYVTSTGEKMRITINRNTYRIITVDRVKG